MSKINAELEIGKEYEVDIVDMGMSFEGIAKVNGMTLFIPGAIKDEKVIVKVVRATRTYGVAKIVRIITESQYREEPVCKSYRACGGCTGLHIQYERTLEMKKETAINTLKKQGVNTEVCGSIYGMGNPYGYRNKVVYPVINFSGKNIMGMYKEGTHDIVDIKQCHIQHPVIDEVARYMYECLDKENLKGYNEKDDTGEVKNIMVRYGVHTGEIMCTYIVNNENRLLMNKLYTITKLLCTKYPKVKTVTVNINTEKNNAILSNITKVLFGDSYITDKIGDRTYNISTTSFFQVNTIGAEVLYELLKKKLNLLKEDVLLELYSGVGSIGIYLADEVSKVYGVEILKEAVDMAKFNCKVNGIVNAKYLIGDAAVKAKEILSEEKNIDVVIVDPPRKGLDKNAIDILKETASRKIGYVSCNVATLARDIKELEDMYNVTSMNFVDMFPGTSHVETVAILEKK